MSARERQLPAERVLNAERVLGGTGAPIGGDGDDSLAQMLARRYDEIRPEKIEEDAGVSARQASYLARRI